MNELVVIGRIGNKRCYLNVDKEEALDRYREECGAPYNESKIEVINFVDEFRAYDVWEKVSV